MSRHLVIARMSAAPRFIVVRTGQELGSERVQPSDTGEADSGSYTEALRLRSAPSTPLGGTTVTAV